jgi:hypothetical protein
MIPPLDPPLWLRRWRPLGGDGTPSQRCGGSPSDFRIARFLRFAGSSACHRPLGTDRPATSLASALAGLPPEPWSVMVVCF